MNHRTAAPKAIPVSSNAVKSGLMVFSRCARDKAPRPAGSVPQATSGCVSLHGCRLQTKNHNQDLKDHRRPTVQRRGALAHRIQRICDEHHKQNGWVL
jgi:hypothetical protein